MQSPDPNVELLAGTESCWTAEDIPDLTGKRALITGGAGGLGLETAKALAGHGAEVILADINDAAGQQAVDEFSRNSPQSKVQFKHLDLADIGQIRTFAASICAEDDALDILINNAGIYPPVQRATTKDGFELEFGINHLGHFALTALLLPALKRSNAPRVVGISSITQAYGRINFDDLQSEKKYNTQKIYSQTKLACLMFSLELQQRAKAADSHLVSLVAHPGIARTTLGNERKNQPRRSLRAWLEDTAQAFAMRFFGQTPAEGALPILYAATAAEAVGGGFYGPDGFGQFAGYPTQVKPSATARDAAQRKRLWQASLELTGVEFNF